MKWYKYPFDKENESSLITKAMHGALLFFAHEPHVNNVYGGGFSTQVAYMYDGKWVGYDLKPINIDHLTHCLFLTEIPRPDPEDAPLRTNVFIKTTSELKNEST